MLRAVIADFQDRALRTFARAAAALARELGVLIDPRHDEERCRLVGGNGRAIDLYNPWHFTGCRADPDRAALQTLLLPRDLGTAGYLGRIDVVERLLAAGADPDRADESGLTPIDRTICAWVTTDLHVACVEALLAAGAPARRSHFDSLRTEAVGSAADIQIAERLAARTGDGGLREELAGLILLWRHI
jgi:hypothetical protein